MSEKIHDRFLCEDAKLTTWDDIDDLDNVEYIATFRNRDLDKITVEAEAPKGSVPFKVGQLYVFEWHAE